VDGAVSGGDSTISSISATSLISVRKHNDGPRCFSKSKVRFYVPGCWGGEVKSLQTDITLGVNTENWDSKESESLGKQFFQSSANGSGNITVTSAGHSPVSGVHKQHYYGCSNSHITVPSKHLQCAVCVGIVCKRWIYSLKCKLLRNHTSDLIVVSSLFRKAFLRNITLCLQWSGSTVAVCVVKHSGASWI